MRRPLVFSALANTGRYALVPPVVVGVLLPAVLLLIRAGSVPQLSSVYVEKCTSLLMPALAAWWPPFVFKERIEGEGRELLYFLKRNGEGATALELGLLYLAVAVPFVLAAMSTSGFSVALMMLLGARCVFVASLAFCAAYVLKSSALGLMLALLFNIVAMAPLEGWAGAPGRVVMLYGALAAVLLVVGEFRGRYFTG